MSAPQTVSGELTFATVPALFDASAGWFAGEGELVIDLSRVERADSAGLALLVEWLRRARLAGRGLQLTGIPAQVQTLIRVNGLAEAFGTHDA